jgi:RNA polymerase sigma factor (sigma-70 family)
MPTTNLSHWLRDLGNAVWVHGAETCSDSQLLHGFLTGAQPGAFAAVVHRHGPMVWQVCCSLVHDAQDAEDAFQATFLVLVQRAASIRRPELLGNWLYGVAYRVAVRARANAARRRARERNGVEMIAVSSEGNAGVDDLRPVVHAELQRLPQKYRAPLLLCYFQGKTSEEAARLLDWPLGTVKGRMSRARELLRGRLLRRGLVTATIAALVAMPTISTAAVPAALLHATINSAHLVAAGKTTLQAAVSARVVALIRGELNTMFLTKLKWSATVTLVLLLAAGTALLAYCAPSPGSAKDSGTPAPVALPAAAQPQQEKPTEAALRMQSLKNLKSIGIAMHDYHSVLGTLPPSAILDKNKKPLLSWRVLLLPYLEEQDLFKQFKLDEPWDSPHNKKLLAAMPKIYAPVGDKAKEPGLTYYQVFTGAGTAFEGERGLRVTDFLDGTSNTLLIIEAGEPVPWTKPADLVYDAKKPLPSLGGLFKDRIHCVLADGSPHTLKRDFKEQIMRWLILRNDGQALDLNDLILDK